MDKSEQETKIRRITRPRLTIRKKLAALSIIRVWTYKKAPQVIDSDLKSNTNILDLDDIMSQSKLPTHSVTEACTPLPPVVRNRSDRTMRICV